MVAGAKACSVGPSPSVSLGIKELALQTAKLGLRQRPDSPHLIEQFDLAQPFMAEPAVFDGFWRFEVAHELRLRISESSSQPGPPEMLDGYGSD